MSEITLNPEQLKEFLKSMERAIAESEATETANREAIFQILNRQP